MPFLPMPFLFSTTQPSSISGSQNFQANRNDPKRPRIQSAANAQFQHGHNKIRKVNAITGSEGLQSTLANSQGELGIVDYNANMMGSGGLSGLSDVHRDGALASVANKYAAPAIKEES